MKNAMRTVSPTGSYYIDVPEHIKEDVDERVVSYWIPGDTILLQLSSYTRRKGQQVSAKERLAVRLNRDQLTHVQSERLKITDCSDVVAASGQDQQETRWLYIYAVWPDIAIFATVSAPLGVSLGISWAMISLRSLRCKSHEN